MDIKLFNNSEIARRIGVTPVYVFFLMTGVRSSEKRLQQVADVLEMSVTDLKHQIRKKNNNGHADKHALAHSQTHSSRTTGRNPRARNLKRIAA
jgi:hypothetical protein